MPGLDFAHAWDESEYMHYAHARTHSFTLRGPCYSRTCYYVMLENVIMLW